MLLDSDTCFVSYEYLAGSLFNATGYPSYSTPVNYDVLGTQAPNKEIYKPCIDSMLGVNNNYEFMLQIPNIFHYTMFKRFRDKVVGTLVNYPNFMVAMQALYVNNRVCKTDYISAWKQYSVLSNFNLLIAYRYFFDSSEVYFRNPTD